MTNSGSDVLQSLQRQLAEEWLTVPEAAAELGVSTTHVATLIRTHEIEALRVGRQMRLISRASFNRFAVRYAAIVKRRATIAAQKAEIAAIRSGELEPGEVLPGRKGEHNGAAKPITAGS